MALDVCGSRGPGDESHTALCQGQKRGCAEPGPNSALMAIAASRCCQKLLTMLLRHVAGEPKVWSVVRVPSEVDEDRWPLQWQGGWPASRLVVTSDTLQYMERRPLRATTSPGPWGAQTSSAMPTSAPAASSHRGFHGVRRTSPTVSSVSRYPRQSWFTARMRIHPLASIRPSVIGVRPRRRVRPSAAWGCRVSSSLAIFD